MNESVKKMKQNVKIEKKNQSQNFPMWKKMTLNWSSSDE